MTSLALTDASRLNPCPAPAFRLFSLWSSHPLVQCWVQVLFNPDPDHVPPPLKDPAASHLTQSKGQHPDKALRDRGSCSQDPSLALPPRSSLPGLLQHLVPWVSLSHSCLQPLHSPGLCRECSLPRRLPSTPHFLQASAQILFPWRLSPAALWTSNTQHPPAPPLYVSP